MGYLASTLVLTRKNFLLSFRDSAALAVTLAAPFFAMLVLYFSQISINNGDDFNPQAFEIREPVPTRIDTIPRCVPFATEDCYTIAYVPSNSTQVDDWVRQVAQRSNIPDNEIRPFSDDVALNDFLVKNPNRTQAAYIFDQRSLLQLENNDVSFIVQYNETSQFEFPLSETDFHTQVVLPAMIHNMNLVIMPQLSNTNLSINLNASVFPHPNLVDFATGAGLDAFGQYGDILTFAIFFLALVFFLYRITCEKERGLRDAMRLAGQTQSQHYISWCLPFLIVNVVLILLTIAFGRAFSFKIFTKNDFIVYFLTMFIFNLALIAWAMLLATITQKSTSVSVVGFNLFIFGYLLASIGGIVYDTNDNGEAVVADNVLFLRELFAVSPATMYVKTIRDLSIAALLGGGVSMSRIAEYPEVYSVRTSWLWMLGSAVVAFVLSLYFDNIIPTEHGIPLSPLYPFLPSYWFPSRMSSTPSSPKATPDESSSDEVNDYAADISNNVYNPEVEDADVRAEREAVIAGERDTAALVIKNISRRFRKLQAVDDVSFSVHRNTAFALLGHNGAGKSTLFKMLVTSLRPTAGDAFIYGHSVRRERDAVRKLLGVCPQFDMYWDRLTGAEHIEVFAALKGMPPNSWKEEVELRMLDVDLTEKANVYAGEYSGGMQRRLSVALSLTGNPKILFLDECTSGADALVRRDLWSTIQRAKEGRVVFLITHSIAEAQYIAGHNNIGIMAKGKLCVLGNAMHLKTKFGAGYGIVVILNGGGDENIASALQEALVGVAEGTTLVSTSVGDNGEVLAKYTLPRKANEAQVLSVLELLESERERFGIRDYSINSTSLEEVFKAITSLSEDKMEEADEEDHGTAPQTDGAPRRRRNIPLPPLTRRVVNYVQDRRSDRQE